MTHDWPLEACIDRVAQRLLDEARERKRRLRVRLQELRGGWIGPQVRGPVLPNGRPSPQWVIYQNAVRNHKRATAELSALLRLAPTGNSLAPSPASPKCSP